MTGKSLKKTETMSGKELGEKVLRSVQEMKAERRRVLLKWRRTKLPPLG